MKSMTLASLKSCPTMRGGKKTTDLNIRSHDVVKGNLTVNFINILQ